MHTLRKLLLAAVLAVAASLLIPAPAQANETVTFCFKVGTDPAGNAVWDCHEIPLPERVHDPRIPDDCPACGLAFDFGDDHITPEARGEYLDSLATGFATLGRSEVAEDPGLAQELREQATADFVASAEALDGERVTFGQTGWVSQETGEFIADDYAPIQSAASYMASGLKRMQWALEQDSEHEIARTTGTFENGYFCFVEAFVR